MVDVIKNKYRIIREIARSNDIVYEAIDSTLGRRIALKELNIAPSLTGQPRRDRIERFHREARATGKLDHPNIVSVSDYFEENGRYFIVMEYLDGQTLRDMMQQRGAFPMSEAINIAGQILDALAYAHLHKVIHRDIKPDNIFILPGGQTKLADFGIARLSEEPALTSNGQVFGTPSYMSPEQIVGQGIDCRSDLFSMGVLLYEMLAGRKPFVGDSVISITYAVMNAEPPILPGIPSPVDQVIRRALSKNPLNRFATADQMKSELRNAEMHGGAFNSTGTGRTGMGRIGMGANPAFPSYPNTQGGYQPAYQQPAGYNPFPGGSPTFSQSPMPPAQGSLPWGWNTQGQNTMHSAPMVMPPSMPSSIRNASGMTAANNPYIAAQQFPPQPREPIFVLTAGGRTLLLSLLAAAILGGSIAFGVIAMQNSYSNYRVKAMHQQLQELNNQGKLAYDSGDYGKAIGIFETALNASPDPSLRDVIAKNLAYSYVQSARKIQQNDWKQSAALYRKALALFEYDAAHKELAALLAAHGDRRGAEDQRNVISSSNPNPDPTPDRLDSRLPAPRYSTGRDQPDAAADPNQFVNDRRNEAKKLIEEGDRDWKNGNTQGARDKWTLAIEKAAGYPESELAQQRISDNMDKPNWTP